MENEIVDALTEYAPLLIPIILIQLALVIAAFWDLIHREKTRGSKWLWVFVILFIIIISIFNLTSTCKLWSFTYPQHIFASLINGTLLVERNSIGHSLFSSTSLTSQATSCLHRPL